jgi:hypothetical protein
MVLKGQQRKQSLTHTKPLGSQLGRTTLCLLYHAIDNHVMRIEILAGCSAHDASFLQLFWCDVDEIKLLYAGYLSGYHSDHLVVFIVLFRLCLIFPRLIAYEILRNHGRLVTHDVLVIHHILSFYG